MLKSHEEKEFARNVVEMTVEYAKRQSGYYLEKENLDADKRKLMLRAMNSYGRNFHWAKKDAKVFISAGGCTSSNETEMFSIGLCTLQDIANLVLSEAPRDAMYALADGEELKFFKTTQTIFEITTYKLANGKWRKYNHTDKININKIVDLVKLRAGQKS